MSGLISAWHWVVMKPRLGANIKYRQNRGVLTSWQYQRGSLEDIMCFYANMKDDL